MEIQVNNNKKAVFRKRSLFIVAICSLFLSHSAWAATVEKIVASVNGQAITMYELDQAMKTMGKDIQKQHHVRGSSLRAKVLDKLIDEKVLEAELKRSNVTVEPHEVDAFIDRILRSSRMTLDQFKEHLLSRGVAFEEYRGQLREQTLRSKFVNDHVGRKINVTERELKDYFEKHMDEFKSASSVRLAQLSILFTSMMTQDDVGEVEKVAMNLYTAAQRTSNFGALAKRYSSTKYRVEGSDLGVVKIDDLQPQMAQMAGMLEVGQVSRPIPTNSGLHLIKVLDRAKTSPKDFSSVRDQVHNAVYDIKVSEALESYVKELRRNAHIDIKGL